MIDTGRPIVQVAREIGGGCGSAGPLSRGRARQDRPPKAWTSTKRTEFDRLSAENAELRVDRGFLKEAVASFAAENQNR